MLVGRDWEKNLKVCSRCSYHFKLSAFERIELLVDADSYLLELVRYIHLNPVRAGLVRDAINYPHSSHAGYLGKRHFEFLTLDWVLAHFSDRADLARKRYGRFVAEGSGEGHRDEFHQGLSEARVIGADSFKEQALRAAGETSRSAPTLDQVVDWVCESAGVDAGDLATPSRRRAPRAATRSRPSGPASRSVSIRAISS